MKNNKKNETPDIVYEIKKDFERRREERRSLEMQWRLNLNYIMGNQYCELGQNGDIQDFGKQYFWQQREVYNHTATVLETRISKLNAIKLGMSVRPMTADESDKQAATFATQILKSVFSENELNALIGEANMWSESVGTSFYKITWDKEKGKCIGMNANGKIFEGDVCIEVCPPFEIYPDSITCTHIDDCRSIIHAKAYAIDEIKSIWGIEVEKEDVNGFTVSGGATLGGLGYTGFVQGMTNGALNNHAMVIERYEAPNAEMINGRLVIIAGNNVIYDGDLPYINRADGKRGFPFARQVASVVPGSFFGTSIVERMIPVQRAFNAVKNRKHEYLNRMTMGVLAVEDGSVDIENLEEEGLSPGKVLVVRQGGRMPTMLELGSVPYELVREEERLLNEFTTISGVSDLMKYSEVPSNNMSGKAIGMLVEQDESRLVLTAQEVRCAVKSMAQQVLRLLKQFAVANRMKSVAGENGEYELKYFCQNDISSDDIVFDVGGDIIESASTRKNMVLSLLQLGLLNDEHGKISHVNKAKVMEMLGFGNWESACEIDDLHIKRAKVENLKLLEGNVECEEIDDHDLHIREHTKAVLSAEYDFIGDAKKRILAHINEHRKMKKIYEKSEQNSENGIDR